MLGSVVSMGESQPGMDKAKVIAYSPHNDVHLVQAMDTHPRVDGEEAFNGAPKVRSWKMLSRGFIATSLPWVLISVGAAPLIPLPSCLAQDGLVHTLGQSTDPTRATSTTSTDQRVRRIDDLHL